MVGSGGGEFTPLGCIAPVFAVAGELSRLYARRRLVRICWRWATRVKEVMSGK